MSRRAVLRGAGGIALPLPFLELMRPRRASAQGKSRRLVIMFSPGGTAPTNWRPSGTETDFALSPILKPLESHKRQLVVIEGLEIQGGNSDGHLNGIGGCLTGREIKTGSNINPNTGVATGWANGISVDQFVAPEVSKTNRFKSLEFGVQSKPGVYGPINFSGPEKPVYPENDPYAAFTRLFADATMTPRDLERLHAQRKTVVDAVLEQYRSMRARVGAEDARRLHAHLAAVREVETQLGALSTGSAVNCKGPALGAKVAVSANDNFPVVSNLQIDLMIEALKCDLTRVVTLNHGGAAGGGPKLTWIGSQRFHHDLSHDSFDVPISVDQMTKINTWYAGQFARLLDKARNIPDATGTLLDSSLFVWVPEFGTGNNHSRIDSPFVLAGEAGGVLRTGRYLKYPRRSRHNNLLVSIVNAMGIPATTFGKPEWCTGPLDRLL